MDLNKRPLDTAEGEISFLNSLTDEDIRQGKIWDRVPTITWSRRVVHKHRHLKMVEAKWNFANKQTGDFVMMFKPMVQRGIPFFWEEKGPMLSQKEYYDILVKSRKEHKQFKDMAQQSLSGKTVVENLPG